MTNVPQETVSLVAERDTSDFMRSINVIANGYMRLANLECEKAQTLFESLDEEELESSGWVQSQLGRLFYEKNEYKEVYY